MNPSEHLGIFNLLLLICSFYPFFLIFSLNFSWFLVGCKSWITPVLLRLLLEAFLAIRHQIVKIKIAPCQTSQRLRICSILRLENCSLKGWLMWQVSSLWASRNLIRRARSYFKINFSPTSLGREGTWEGDHDLYPTWKTIGMRYPKTAPTWVHPHCPLSLYFGKRPPSLVAL